MNKVLKWLSLIGPGLFLIGYNIGTGSVTSMAQAGAKHGMSLFWALLLSCIFTYVLMVVYGRMTIVSGKTALYTLKTEFKYGWIIALYILIAVVIGEWLALMGVMGIVADLVQEGLRIISGTVIHRFWIILCIAVLMYILLWKGKYKQFEKVLTVFVILMALSFLLIFFLVDIDWKEIIFGLVPKKLNTPGAMGLIAAMAGTTCSAAVFVVRSIVVTEKGWTEDDIATEKKDSFVSASMMLLLSGLIMAVAAGTLHVKGMSIQNTMDMVHLFEPLGGKWAVIVLILGVTCAGLSTVFPIVLIAPWLVSDYTGQSRNLRSPSYRLLIIIAFVFAFGSVIINKRPPSIMLFSMAMQACILPAVAIPGYILINRASIMNKYTASTKMNIGIWAVIIFSIVTTYFAIVDLMNL